MPTAVVQHSLREFVEEVALSARLAKDDAPAQWLGRANEGPHQAMPFALGRARGFPTPKGYELSLAIVESAIEYLLRPQLLGYRRASNGRAA